MANGLKTTWRRIRSLLGVAPAHDTTDVVLLARFVAGRDEVAFAELARRHGPLVYGVCCRVLANPHDAEDAFQATFLILSSKAPAIRNGDSLSCWLHGVALRVAVRLRQNNRRRKEQAPLPDDVPQAEKDDVSWREVRRLLDEELARLPERFRQPLILCYLEGKTRDAAAAALGWSLTTFRGRLERGRERLRRRLERRGVALSAALLATLAARQVEAAIPTLTAASSNATALATEVMRTMFLNKVKAAALGCFMVLLLGVGAGTAAYRYAEAGPMPSRPEPPKTGKPPAPPEGERKLADENEVLKAEKPTAGPIKKWRSAGSTPLPKVLTPPVESLAFSPAGTRLLVHETAKNTIRLLATDTLKELSIQYPLDDGCRPLGFTSDGLALALCLKRGPKPPEVRDPFTYQLLHLPTGKQLRLFETPWPVRDAVLSPDLKYLAVTDHANTSRVALWVESGKMAGELGHRNAVQRLAISPDGKTLATGTLASEKEPGEVRLWDIERRKAIAWQELPGSCAALQFTRDGSRLFVAANRPQTGAGMVEWFKATNDKRLGRLEGPSAKAKAPVAAVAASPDGKLLAVLWGSGKEKSDGTRLRIYDVDGGKEVAAPDCGRQVSAVAFSPDGNALATGEDNGVVTLWEAVR